MSVDAAVTTGLQETPYGASAASNDFWTAFFHVIFIHVYVPLCVCVHMHSGPTQTMVSESFQKLRAAVIDICVPLVMACFIISFIP